LTPEKIRFSGSGWKPELEPENRKKTRFQSMVGSQLIVDDLADFNKNQPKNFIFESFTEEITKS
jgi:hypothetical protein